MRKPSSHLAPAGFPVEQSVRMPGFADGYVVGHPSLSGRATEQQQSAIAGGDHPIVQAGK